MNVLAFGYVTCITHFKQTIVREVPLQSLKIALKLYITHVLHITIYVVVEKGMGHKGSTSIEATAVGRHLSGQNNIK